MFKKNRLIIIIFIIIMTCDIQNVYSMNVDKHLLDLIKFYPDGRPTFSKVLSHKGIFPSIVSKMINNNFIIAKNKIKKEVSYTYYNQAGKFDNGRIGFSTQETEFNKNGDPIELIFWDSNTTENYFRQLYLYDKNNNLIEIKSQSNSLTAPFITIAKNKYDKHNNLIEKSVFDNCGNFLNNTVFKYDNNNNLTQKDENGFKKNEFKYDSKNNLIELICYDYYSINYIFDFIYPIFETKNDITIYKYDKKNNLTEENRNVYGEKFDERFYKYDSSENLIEYYLSGKSHNKKIIYKYEESTIEIVHIDTITSKILETKRAIKQDNKYEIISYDSVGNETQKLIFNLDNYGNFLLTEELIAATLPYKRTYKYDKNGLKKECIMEYKSGKIGKYSKYIYYFFN